MRTILLLCALAWPAHAGLRPVGSAGDIPPPTSTPVTGYSGGCTPVAGTNTGSGSQIDCRPLAQQPAATGDVVGMAFATRPTVSAPATYATYGQMFEQGAVAASDGLSYVTASGTIPVQLDQQTHWPDGSQRYTLISLKQPAVAANSRVSGMLTKATPPSGAARGLPDLVTGLATVSITIHPSSPSDPATSTVTYDLATLPSSAIVSGGDRLSGPLVTERRFDWQPSNAPGSFHITADVRDYADGTVWVDYRLGNDLVLASDERLVVSWDAVLKVGSSTYDSAADTGGVVNMNAGSIYHRALASNGQGTPQAAYQPDIDSMTRAGAFPKYDASNGITDYIRLAFSVDKHSTLSSSYQPACLQPMNPCTYVLDMGTTGGRPDIGILPEWNTAYLMTLDPGTWYYNLAQSDAGGYIPWHAYESVGIPVRVDTAHYRSFYSAPGKWKAGAAAGTQPTRDPSLILSSYSAYGIDLTPAGDYTLTAEQASTGIISATQTSASGYIVLRGHVTGARNVIVPNTWQGWIWDNTDSATTGATITVKTAAGTGVPPRGTSMKLVADGLNVVFGSTGSTTTSPANTRVLGSDNVAIDISGLSGTLNLTAAQASASTLTLTGTQDNSLNVVWPSSGVSAGVHYIWNTATVTRSGVGSTLVYGSNPPLAIHAGTLNQAPPASSAVPVIVDGPYSATGSFLPGTNNHCADKEASTGVLCTEGEGNNTSIGPSHAPDAHFMMALLTGSRMRLDDMNAQWCYEISDVAIGNGARGSTAIPGQSWVPGSEHGEDASLAPLVVNNQVRGDAWVSRQIFESPLINKEGTPMRAYADAATATLVRQLHSYLLDGPANSAVAPSLAYPGLMPGVYGSSAQTFFAPWMQGFMMQALHTGKQVGVAGVDDLVAALNYLPLCLQSSVASGGYDPANCANENGLMAVRNTSGTVPSRTRLVTSLGEMWTNALHDQALNSSVVPHVLYAVGDTNPAGTVITKALLADSGLNLCPQGDWTCSNTDYHANIRAGLSVLGPAGSGNPALSVMLAHDLLSDEKAGTGYARTYFRSNPTWSVIP